MVTAPNLNCPPSWKARQKLITGTSAGAPVGRHRMPALSAFGKQTVIGQASRVHLRVAWLCGMVLFLEGYDIAAVGYAIPALADTWRITASGFTPALTAGNVGSLLGSLSAGLLRDRLPRSRTADPKTLRDGRGPEGRWLAADQCWDRLSPEIFGVFMAGLIAILVLVSGRAARLKPFILPRSCVALGVRFN